MRISPLSTGFGAIFVNLHTCIIPFAACVWSRRKPFRWCGLCQRYSGPSFCSNLKALCGLMWKSIHAYFSTVYYITLCLLRKELVVKRTKRMEGWEQHCSIIWRRQLMAISTVCLFYACTRARLENASEGHLHCWDLVKRWPGSHKVTSGRHCTTPLAMGG